MNSFQTLSRLTIGGDTLYFHSLKTLEAERKATLRHLPFSSKILLENLLRFEDGQIVTSLDIEAFLSQDPQKQSDYEIQFTPARVLLQDFTGVPVIADLAALRDGMERRGGDSSKVNPLRPVDLVIDHSVQMDFFAEPSALSKNVSLEFARNAERYSFLKWGQKAFRNLRVVPPSTGICHQINLEFLAQVAMVSQEDDKEFVYPDTLIGTDSHTTMVNGLGVLGWGVGGIEAEAAMLGQPCPLLIPQVVGFELTGKLKPGVTATDLVLRVTQMLRQLGVVGKFVEYFGDGVSALSIGDRATVANMAPEYGATIGIFPVDEKVVSYLKLTGRRREAERTEAYFKEQGMWGCIRQDVHFAQVLKLDLGSVEPSMAGPSRPQDRVPLGEVGRSFRNFLLHRNGESLQSYKQELIDEWMEMSDSMKGIAFDFASFHKQTNLGPLSTHCSVTLSPQQSFELVHGTIVIAAITSCTNTSNPALMLGAALLARNACLRGLKSKPWVKTTFAPGSLAVRDYLLDSGLMPYLEQLGFHIAGFGCATCIGNSGPLPSEIQAAIEASGIATVAVLSGNRNFEARIHPFVMANYLASPPLVVAAALFGNINYNFEKTPLARSDDGSAVYLSDIWPDASELESLMERFVRDDSFSKAYENILDGDSHWKATKTEGGALYEWQASSSYIKRPPFVDEEFSRVPADIKDARILGVFGDSITTDHISPAGSISASSPAGRYLLEHGVAVADFNSYGSRRGNHEVMVRGTFANVRIRNKMVKREGGYTKVYPHAVETTMFDAAVEYAKGNVPLVVVAGKEYGSGSSRDWAAKGPRLLGVRAVLAISFERIHRSNLVGMGVLPLQLLDVENVEALGLVGDEVVDLPPLQTLSPRQTIEVALRRANSTRRVNVLVRIDTPNELKYFHAGGILPFVLGRLKSNST